MNRKRERYKRLIKIGAAVILLFMLTGIFGYVWYKYYSDVIVLPFYRRGNWVLIAIYCMLTTLFFRVYGGFRIGYLKSTDMLYSQFLSMIFVNVVTFFLISLIGRHFMDSTPVVVMTAVDLGVIALWTAASNKMFLLIYPPRKLIILYGSHQAAEIVIKMSERVDKYMICESINFSEDPEVIREQILKYEGVIICDIPAEERNDYLKFCFENSIRVYITPKISDIIVRGAEDIRLFDSPLILCRNCGLDVEQRIIKRTFDIIFSLIALVPALPIMLIMALLIKLYDGGPVLYKQKRLTIDYREFDVYKFRSMVVDAEKKSGPVLASDDDPRITPVGKFLRKVRLDELPQLFNILKGDMSVVGPRPERPELTAEYKKQMPEFDYRLKVKAGLTGYAQVTGVYDTTPYDKLKMDLMYIENYSIKLDIQIIIMTLKIMLFPKKSNAETEGALLQTRDEKNNDDE